MEKYFLFYIIVVTWSALPVIYIHRDLTHRQVKFSKPLVYLAKLIEWSKYSRYYAVKERVIVAAHLQHHKFSDGPKDPHLPWFTMTQLSKDEIFKLTKNYEFDYSKFDMFLEKFRYGNLVLLAIFYMIWSWEGCILWAINYLVASWYYRMFNMLSHTFPGYTIGKMLPRCKARNLPGLFAFIFPGEDLHGNHHIWPTRANFGVKWWELDFAYIVIKMLSWVGLAKITESGKSKPITESTEFKWVK